MRPAERHGILQLQAPLPVITRQSSILHYRAFSDARKVFCSASSEASDLSSAPWWRFKISTTPARGPYVRSRKSPRSRVNSPVWSPTWGICTRRAGKLYRARSRLYRRRFLQVNMRWKALAEIYTMHSFAPFSWDPSGFSKLNFLPIVLGRLSTPDQHIILS